MKGKKEPGVLGSRMAPRAPALLQAEHWQGTGMAGPDKQQTKSPSHLTFGDTAM